MVVLEGDDGYRGLILLGDVIRSDSARAIDSLRALGLRVVLLTGDRVEVARRVAGEAGVEEVHAGVDPKAKAAWIRDERTKGARVLFAGDGLNDGPALVSADVGVAMGTGVASSVLAADGVLASSSLLSIVAGVRAGRASKRSIRLNQARSIVYNVAAVTAAAFGLVNPLVAAVLMPLSSVWVVWGASRVEARMKAGIA